MSIFGSDAPHAPRHVASTATREKKAFQWCYGTGAPTPLGGAKKCTITSLRALEAELRRCYGDKSRSPCTSSAASNRARAAS